MRQRRLIALMIVCAAVAAGLLLSTRPISAKNHKHENNNNDNRDQGQETVDGRDPPSPFNNRPAVGIPPADLDSEIARVLREIDVIEGRAIERWHSLPLPTRLPQRPGPNPPVLQGTGTESIETLGELMLFDKNISPGRNQACTSCHMPYAAWSGPIPSVNLTIIAYPGTVHFRAGKRTAQRHTYAPFFPVLQYNQEQGLFFGGNFWDSRATGYRLRNPDAEQAQGPPVDTQEMGFPDTACVAFRLSQAVYKPLFEVLWGKDSLNIKLPQNTEEICETPGGAAVFGGDPEPIKLRPEERTEAETVYDHSRASIEAYEQSMQVSTFTSKFDAMLKGNYTFTPDEQAGFQLFNGKGNCNSCHVDGRGTTLNPGQVDTSTTATANPPVFTCFGSANEGLPLNPRDAFYYQTTPCSFGLIGIPFGFSSFDLGMGTSRRNGFA